MSREELGKVYLTQYIRPNGRKSKVTCEVPKKTEKQAENMILSCEVLTTGEVAIYARFNDEEEEMENLGIAKNEEGDKRPDKVLINLIDRTYKARYKNE